MIHSYPSIYALGGHKAVTDIFNGDIVVQEKVDGSQFSFGVLDGSLYMRSKGQEIHIGNAPMLFQPAVDTVLKAYESGLLVPDCIYRGEAFSKPKHNALAYDRVPTGNIALFDVELEGQEFLTPEDVRAVATRVGVEAVPTFYEGDGAAFKAGSDDAVPAILDRESILGGQKIEGFVVKNYSLYGPDKKVLMAKFVSERFKEIHRKEWKFANPTGADWIDSIANSLRTDARWEKAIIHLRERDELTDSPKDIGPLLKEINSDILKECREEIIEALFKYAWPKISRGTTVGFPEYKKRLMDELLAETNTCE